MAERFVGIDVALREHRIAVLDRDGEAVGASFTIRATRAGIATLLQALRGRGAAPGNSMVGLEATGHLWENLEAALTGAGYRLPEHRPALGDLLPARVRGSLTQFPTAYHLAQASARAIRRAAEDAGGRGFSLDEATTLRETARRSLYSGKAATARGQVVRTLVAQIERLTTALAELDRASEALLPPAPPGAAPSDADLLCSIPGIGPHTAATLLGERGDLSRFVDARALVAYVGFYPLIRESRARGHPDAVAHRLQHRPARALPGRRQCRAAQS